MLLSLAADGILFEETLPGEDRAPQHQEDLSQDQKLAKLKILYDAAFGALAAIWGDVEIMGQFVCVWNEYPTVRVILSRSSADAY